MIPIRSSKGVPAVPAHPASPDRYSEVAAWRTQGRGAVPDVTRLDEAAVFDRVFPGLSGVEGASLAGWRARSVASGWTNGGLPPGWVPGEPPTPALPIDDEVSRLRAPRPGDRFRLAEAHLEALGIACPYYAARQAVVVAARVGRHQAQLRDASTALGRRAADMRDVADTLTRLLRDQPGDPVAAVTPLDQRQDPIAAFRRREAQDTERAVMGSLLETLRVHADGLEAALPSGQRADWRLGFARSLTFVWFVLAGEKPSPKEGSRFQTFVAAAYATLDPEAEEDWTSPCKRARREVETWPRWAGVDWMVNAGIPGIALSRRTYRTMAEAREGAGREVARLLRVSSSLLPEARAALEAHGADLIALSVATAGDSNVDFAEVLEIAHRAAAFRRRTLDAIRSPPPQGSE